jgi:sulfonate transport system ATP-binding protein
LVCQRGVSKERRASDFFGEQNMSIVAVNSREQLTGRIKEIILGPVVSEIDVETPFAIVTSVITTRSVKDLELKISTEVLALVKPIEVSIAKL